MHVPTELMLHIIGPIEKVESSYIIIILTRHLVAISICSCTSYKTVAIYTHSYTEQSYRNSYMHGY